MKKFITSGLFILLFGLYMGLQYTGSSFSVTAPVLQSSKVSGMERAAKPVPSPNMPVTPSSIASALPPKPKGFYADGTYIGDTADAYYGYIQVQATISNGKLADVQFLQYPNDRRTSVMINQRAIPVLKSEALQVQSAQVNGVSGATDTSAAFRESLGSALTQAKA